MLTRSGRKTWIGRALAGGSAEEVWAIRSVSHDFDDAIGMWLAYKCLWLCNEANLKLRSRSRFRCRELRSPPISVHFASIGRINSDYFCHVNAGL